VVAPKVVNATQGGRVGVVGWSFCESVRERDRFWRMHVGFYRHKFGCHCWKLKAFEGRQQWRMRKGRVECEFLPEKLRPKIENI